MADGLGRLTREAIALADALVLIDNLVIQWRTGQYDAEITLRRIDHVLGQSSFQRPVGWPPELS